MSTTPTARWIRALVVCCAALAATGCVPEERPPATAALRAGLHPVRVPNLNALEPAVRQQLSKLHQSVEALATLPSADPQRLGNAYGELGRLYHAYELFEAARDAYSNAQNLLPEDYRWSHYLGHVERALGHPQQSLVAFDRALELEPKDLPALVAKAQLLRDLRRLEPARRSAEQALRLDPHAAGALLVLAQLAADQGDPTTAARHYEELLAAQPEATKLHQPLAMAYRSTGRIEAARRHLQLRGEGTVAITDPLLSELEPLRSGFWSDPGVGELAFKQGDYAAAAAAYRRAVERQPQNTDAWVSLGSALFRAGRVQEAVSAYQRALAQDSSHAGAHFNLGTALARSGDDQKAIGHYQAALRANPGYGEARFNLANALRRSGRCEEAIQHYRQLVDHDPGNGSARLGEAVCLVDAGRYSEAKQRLELAANALPRSPTFANARARLLAACPDPAVRDGRQALSIAQRLVSLQRRPEYLETLAMALAETGAFQNAITIQQTALAGAQQAGQFDLIERLQSNLIRYQHGQPCRDPALG